MNVAPSIGPSTTMVGAVSASLRALAFAHGAKAFIVARTCDSQALHFTPVE
ncbi:MAG TPA: hypothetical protein VK753_02570 [Xanthomonadaceae bacterium]|nr:hypothetical protein [Xanthomonadaceae bacterium]